MSKLHKQYLDSLGINRTFKSEMEKFSSLAESYNTGLYSTQVKNAMKTFEHQYSKPSDLLQERISDLATLNTVAIKSDSFGVNGMFKSEIEKYTNHLKNTMKTFETHYKLPSDLLEEHTSALNAESIKSQLLDGYTEPSYIKNMIANANSAIQGVVGQLAISKFSDSHTLLEQINLSPYSNISSSLYKKHSYELEGITSLLGLKSFESIAHGFDISRFDGSAASLIKEHIERYSLNDFHALNVTLQQIDNKLSPHYFDEESMGDVNYNWFTPELLIAYISLLIALFGLAHDYHSSNQSNKLRASQFKNMNTMQKIQRNREMKKQNYYLGTKLDKILLKKNIEIAYKCLRSHVRLRDRPDTNQSKVLTKLSKNVTVLLLKREGQWIECEYFDLKKQHTFIGWVHISNFRRIKD